MKFNLISDSCCDMPIDMQREKEVSIAPLSVTIDEKMYLDDEHLDLNEFLGNMKSCTRMTSGAPSPVAFLDHFKQDAVNFIVTLSSKVSGSFSSALIAKNIAQDDDFDVHVFDSKSASAGQLLTTLKIKEKISKGLEKSEIISSIDNYINELKTYYVSQDLNNFIKSGRLSKIKGKILTALGIRPILGADENGDLHLFSHARGDAQTISKFIDLIKTSGKKTDGEDLVITHCNNHNLACSLRKLIEETFRFRQIIIEETRALSSMYAGNKGLVMAF